MAKRGRPPLEPRIAKLEQFVEEFFAGKYVEWQQRIGKLEQAMTLVEHQIRDLKDPVIRQSVEYQSNFDKWPNHGRPPE